MLGYAFCGSFCTHARALRELERLAEAGEELLPVFSHAVLSTDTRFGKAEELISAAEKVCGREGVKTVASAEPLGPAVPLEALIISPCTGNTLAKIACGITDTAVTMAAKATLRSDSPILIALASNDALAANLQNIALLLSKKSVYFLPMRQDDVLKKPHSLVAEFLMLSEALAALRRGEQLRPLFL